MKYVKDRDFGPQLMTGLGNICYPYPVQQQNPHLVHFYQVGVA